ncbi:MAG: hypothetical protein EXX96DRAFT_349858 [Benjaminiella poitrasii]|nr:MAG: hypothetical protein EXX96DRAFT_349858 [Benjaminiella poitrasii]
MCKLCSFDCFSLSLLPPFFIAHIFIFPPRNKSILFLFLFLKKKEKRGNKLKKVTNFPFYILCLFFILFLRNTIIIINRISKREKDLTKTHISKD